VFGVQSGKILDDSLGSFHIVHPRVVCPSGFTMRLFSVVLPSSILRDNNQGRCILKLFTCSWVQCRAQSNMNRILWNTTFSNRQMELYKEQTPKGMMLLHIEYYCYSIRGTPQRRELLTVRYPRPPQVMWRTIWMLFRVGLFSVSI